MLEDHVLDSMLDAINIKIYFELLASRSLVLIDEYDLESLVTREEFK
jgi:hypothetical protein